MHIERGSNKTVIYPKVSQSSQFDAFADPSVVITENMHSVTMLHRAYNKNEWKLVQFSIMRKEELQQYIDELQNICNKL